MSTNEMLKLWRTERKTRKEGLTIWPQQTYSVSSLTAVSKNKEGYKDKETFI
jgi:hypothetical protein